jgi:hypothetical protein
MFEGVAVVGIISRRRVLMDGLKIPRVLLALAAFVLLSSCSASISGVTGTPSVRPTVPAGSGYDPVTFSLDPVPAVFIGGSATDKPPFGEGVDAVILTFAPGPPTCEVRYVDPPITDDQTGATVDVAGTAFLRVQCREVTQVSLSEPTADPSSSFDTKPGSDRFDGTAQTVTEVVQTGFDGSTLTFTIGLRNKLPFGVGEVGSADGAQQPGLYIQIVR